MTCTIKRWKKAQHVERKYWVKVSQGYDERMKRKHWMQWILKPFDLTFKSFEDKILVQIGCGPQGLINFLTVDGGMKMGVDPLMKSYMRSYDMPSDSYYLVGMAEGLPIKSGTIDVAMCVNMLDHTISPEETLSEIYRILKNRGLLIFQVNLVPPFKAIVKFFLKTSLTDTVAHPHKINAQWLIDRLTRSKFKIIKGMLDAPWWHKKRSIDQFNVIDRLLFRLVKKSFAAGLRILAIKEEKNKKT